MFPRSIFIIIILLFCSFFFVFGIWNLPIGKRGSRRSWICETSDWSDLFWRNSDNLENTSVGMDCVVEKRDLDCFFGPSKSDNKLTIDSRYFPNWKLRSEDSNWSSTIGISELACFKRVRWAKLRLFCILDDFERMYCNPWALFLKVKNLKTSGEEKKKKKTKTNHLMLDPIDKLIELYSNIWGFERLVLL